MRARRGGSGDGRPESDPGDARVRARRRPVSHDGHGSETVRLTATRARESEPAVSADRTRIAYGRGGDELWLTDAAGSNQRRLLGRRPSSVFGASTGSPSWSPGGRLIHFGMAGRLAVVDTSGRLTKDLRTFRSAPGFDVQPSWSPDGHQITFVAWDYLESGRSALYIVNRDGSGLRRLTQSTFETSGPA